ncbi:hypothetical protein KZ810_02590 [Sphingomonas sp. RHCKR47]|uniref:hypothetical protein n=1 Tax=Sphingomonas citricola TaxID=2862498 RepID=UPI001CA58621|nr:hypothetical protein [Sphingomonas citricola]MBW6522375.1 hypothetical protein [Sphingomonas citricola]
MYDGTQSTVERALELARSGSVGSMGELRKKLSAEQHIAVDITLSGRSIQAQLKAAIAEARKPG